MNDYMTFKNIDSDRMDAARRQRNADHLAVIAQVAPSLRQRVMQWWTRRMPAPDASLEQRTQRLQSPPCTEPARLKSGV